MSDLRRAVDSLETASKALTGFVLNMRYLVESQLRMERRQRRIHAAVMLSLIPLSIAVVLAVNYAGLLLLDPEDVIYYDSTEVERKVYPIGIPPRLYSTRALVWNGEIKTVFDEHLICDLDGDGTFSLFSSRPKPVGRTVTGPTPLMRLGPWPSEFTRYPQQPTACCVQSDIDATVSRLGASVTTHQSVNDTCNAGNIFRYK